MPEPEYLLRCECGHMYDLRDREQGEFHFRVLMVDKDVNQDGSLRVVGNLRGGVLNAGQELQLVRRDGSTVAITGMSIHPPPGEAALRKGQRELAVFTPTPESVHANACIRPASA